MQIRASLNHSKKMKAERSRLIPQKLAENLELLNCWRKIFRVLS